MRYIDRVFKSYKSNFPVSTLTMEQWLDGDRGWRKPLREIGGAAHSILMSPSVETARREWGYQLHVRPWIRGYVIAVPLLDDTAARADHDNKAFMRFMMDLATLADI